MKAHGDHPVVFFDGVCGLCNRLVDRLVRWDRRSVLRFAPLQGETARRMLGPEAFGSGVSGKPASGGLDSFETIVLVDGSGVFRRSDAVLAAFAYLGGPWRLTAALRLVPRSVRDGVYRYIAARRYRWFGRRSACRVPAPEESGWFLP